MATISGSLIFDINRNATLDIGDYGISDIPIVLQNKVTNDRLGVFTDLSGLFSFINVPAGDYRLIVVYEYTGKTLITPASFQPPNIEVNGEIPDANLPPYTVLKGPYPDGTNHLNTVTPTTEFISVLDNDDLTAPPFFIGPVKYEPITNILDPCATIYVTNLITDASAGNFGTLPAGTSPNGGPDINPYPNIAPDFTFVKQSQPIHDGEYSIGNTIDPYPEFHWWRLSDHTSSIETGMMEIVNGYSIGARFFTTTVSILPNTNYVFSAWIANIDNDPAQVPPKLGALIKGEKGDILYYESLGQDIPTNAVLPMWKQIGTALNSGDNTLINLSFFSEGNAANGNDYAVDDVYLNRISFPIFTPTKISNKTYANLGDTVTYTITLSNTCTSSLTNVIFQDTVPNGLTFIDGSVKVNTVPFTLVNVNTGFTIPNIIGDSTTTIVYQATVTSIPSTTIVNNIANMKYKYTPIVGGIPNSFNKDSNTIPLYIGKAIIGGETIPNNGFKKSVDKDYAIVGDILTYTIVADNTGNVDASNVEIVDTIPKGITYLQNSITSNVEITGSPLTQINLVNPLKPGQEAIISFKATVDTVPNPNPIPNRASVDYKYTSNPDILNGSSGTGITNTVNTSIVDTNISIFKSENRQTAIVGDLVTYTIDVEDIGIIDFSNVTITDILKPKLTFKPGSLKINGISSDKNINNGVNIGVIKVGVPTQITFQATVNTLPKINYINNNCNVKYEALVGDKIYSLSQNSNTVSIFVPDPSLNVTKVSSSESVVVGDTFKYNITVTNSGDTFIKDIILEDILPTQFKIINITINGVNTNETELQGLNIGDLSVGETKTIVATIMVVSGGLNNYKNIVLAKGTVQLNPNDPKSQVIGRGEDPNSINVLNPIYNVKIIKSANRCVTNLGCIINYSLLVVNNGNRDVGIHNYPLVIYDKLSPSICLIRGSLIINGIRAYNENLQYGIRLGTLKTGKFIEIKYSVQVCSCCQNPILNMAKASYGYSLPNGEIKVESNTSNNLRITIC